jgi:uncharacterized protein YrzB (UPF0473 family)
MENLSAVESLNIQAGDTNNTFSVFSVSEESGNKKIFRVVLTDLNEGGARIPGSDCTFINLYSDEDGDEKLLYQMSTFNYLLTTTATVVSVNNSDDDSEDSEGEETFVQFEQKFRPFSFRMEGFTGSSNIIVTSRQMNICGNKTESNFSTPDGIQISRTGDGVGCLSGCCGRGEVINANTISYVVHFSENNTNELKMLTLLSCFFIESVMFGSSGFTSTEYVRSIKDT